jgi:hypothetical protein
VVRYECFTSTCAPGTTRTESRPAGTAFIFDFQIGWGFGHPDPVMPKTEPNLPGAGR